MSRVADDIKDIRHPRVMHDTSGKGGGWEVQNTYRAGLSILILISCIYSLHVTYLNNMGLSIKQPLTNRTTDIQSLYNWTVDPGSGTTVYGVNYRQPPTQTALLHRGSTYYARNCSNNFKSCLFLKSEENAKKDSVYVEGMKLSDSKS